VVNGKRAPLKQNLILGIENVKMHGPMVLPQAMDLWPRKYFPGSKTRVGKNIDEIGGFGHALFSLAARVSAVLRHLSPTTTAPWWEFA
jgi:hypothetical protein